MRSPQRLAAAAVTIAVVLVALLLVGAIDASAMREVCGKQRDKLCRMKSVTKVLH